MNFGAAGPKGRTFSVVSIILLFAENFKQLSQNVGGNVPKFVETCCAFGSKCGDFRAATPKSAPHTPVRSKLGVYSSRALLFCCMYPVVRPLSMA